MALVTATACGGDDAGEYPSSNVTIIVPYDAGANVDTQARAIAPCLEDAWGNRVLVENHPGSGGAVGTRELANAEPDGYTLSLSSVSPYVLAPRLMGDIGYTSDDLRSFGYITEAPVLFFVDADSEFETLDELVEAAQNDTITVSTPGTDSLQGLLAQQFNSVYDTDFNIIPNDSTNEIVRGVNEGDWTAGITITSLDLIPRIESGEVKVLGRGGDDGYEFLDGIPSYSELGYDDLLPITEITLPLIGPADVPDDVATEIESTLEGCLQEPDVVEGLGEEIVPASFTGGSESMEQYDELGAAIDEMD